MLYRHNTTLSKLFCTSLQRLALDSLNSCLIRKLIVAAYLTGAVRCVRRPCPGLPAVPPGLGGRGTLYGHLWARQTAPYRKLRAVATRWRGFERTGRYKHHKQSRVAYYVNHIIKQTRGAIPHLLHQWCSMGLQSSGLFWLYPFSAKLTANRISFDITADITDITLVRMSCIRTAYAHFIPTFDWQPSYPTREHLEPILFCDGPNYLPIDVWRI